MIKGSKRREKIYQKQHKKTRSKESFKLSSTDAEGSELLSRPAWVVVVVVAAAAVGKVSVVLI